MLAFLAIILSNVADDRWQSLFDGQTFAGWTMVSKDPKGDSKSTWSIENGVIRCTGMPNGYLATKASFSDYILRVSYRYPASAKAGNSGILLHCQPTDRVWPNSVEAQMRAGRAGDVWLNADDAGVLPTIGIDLQRFDTKDKNKRHYFRIEPKLPIEKPFGEWNLYEIRCQKGAIELILNGVKVNEASSGSLTSGRIALQSEGTPVEFRNLEIKILRK